MRFAKKAVIVTGGARGMGAEHARQLVKHGAKVLITDILTAEGEALAAELGELAHFVTHDVADEQGWRTVMAEAERFAGGLDGLVNNAAIAQFGPLQDVEVETYLRHQRVNELSVFLGMKHAAPLLAARGGGSIVNISSLGGMRAGGNDVAYVGSKWAVRGITKSAAKELGPSGIRVNSVHPGMVATAMFDEVPDDVLADRRSRIPLRRLGTLGDISNLVLFLLSDQAAYITGAEVVIDGGLVL